MEAKRSHSWTHMEAKKNGASSQFDFTASLSRVLGSGFTLTSKLFIEPPAVLPSAEDLSGHLPQCPSHFEMEGGEAFPITPPSNL